MANRWQKEGGHPTSQTPPGRLSVRGRTRSQKRKPAKAPPGVKKPLAQKMEAQKAAKNPPPRPRMLPVKIIQAFYQNLPDDSLQQIAHASELEYSNQSMVLDGQIQLVTTTVPELTVFVYTDIEFYALASSGGLLNMPVALDPYNLAGCLQFRVDFNNHPPMFMRYDTFGAYRDDTVGNLARDPNGWGFLDTKFGAERTSGFAVYARGGEVVRMYAVAVNQAQLPQFPIHRLGVRVAGFSVNENAFDSIWLSSGNVSM
jgi:hypothetical protein